MIGVRPAWPFAQVSLVLSPCQKTARDSCTSEAYRISRGIAENRGPGGRERLPKVSRSLDNEEPLGLMQTPAEMEGYKAVFTRLCVRRRFSSTFNALPPFVTCAVARDFGTHIELTLTPIINDARCLTRQVIPHSSEGRRRVLKPPKSRASSRERRESRLICSFLMRYAAC